MDELVGQKQSQVIHPSLPRNRTQPHIRDLLCALTQLLFTALPGVLFLCVFVVCLSRVGFGGCLLTDALLRMNHAY